VKWTLDAVVKGDELALFPVSRVREVRIVEVTRVTKTQIVLGRSKYLKRTGDEVKPAYSVYTVRIPTPEMREYAARFEEWVMCRARLNFHIVTRTDYAPDVDWHAVRLLADAAIALCGEK